MKKNNVINIGQKHLHNFNSLLFYKEFDGKWYLVAN